MRIVQDERRPICDELLRMIDWLTRGMHCGRKSRSNGVRSFEAIRGGEEERSSPWMQAIMTALREASEGSRGPERSPGMLPEAAREVGPSLQRATEEWRTWQADLQEAVQQPSFSSRVERGRIGAGIPAASLGLASSPQPLVDWAMEGEVQEGSEGPSGYSGESAPSFLPLTRVGADAEPEDRGTPYPWDTASWEN